jgi:ATP-binding cassette subfamily B protein
MKNTSLKHYKHLLYIFHYLYRYKIYLYSTFFLLSVSAFTVLALGISLKYFANQGLTGILYLKKSILFFAILLFILAISSGFRSFFIELLCKKVCGDIRYDLYNKTIQLQPQFLESNQLGNITSKIMHDVSVIQTVIPTVFSFFIRNLLMLIGGLVLLFITNRYLTILTIVIVPVALFPVLMIGRKLKVLSLKSQEIIGKIADRVDEAVHAIKEIQANCQENKEATLFKKILSVFITQVKTQLFIRSIFIASIILVVSYIVLAIFWIGSNQVILAQIQAGDLLSFVFYAIVVASSLAGMSEVYADINKANAAAESIHTVLDLKTLTTKPYQDIKNFNITFKDVSFSYPNRKTPVLDKMSFLVTEGEKIAITGSSGIGKTTLLELLLKFYQPDTGDIFIGNKNIQDIDVSQLRQLISYVAQDPYIFEATLKENLEYGSNNLSEKTLYNILTAVNLDAFLSTLPHGLNTILNKKATNLSGGQKHRIALARALLRQSKILLLDEVTNGLDAKNETIICELIKQESRTTIIVTHKQAIIDICDRVIQIIA